MTENVTNFPKSEVPSIAGVPRRGCFVFIDGRVIPNMHCFRRETETEIVVDGRFSYTFPNQWAYLAASMAAQAMAVGAGYSCMSAETKGAPFAPRVVELNEVPHD